MRTLDIRRVQPDQAEQAAGIVVVIDVIRAFTVAAYAFAGGATDLWLVRTVEEAQALREFAPGALLAGEVGGRLIPGFDLNNSPYLMAQADVNGKRIIQRTGAGTQGAVGASHATHLLVGALTNARATAHYARCLSEASGLPITFVPTTWSANDSRENEDDYCADYITAILLENGTAEDVLKDRLQRLIDGDRFKQWNNPDSDMDYPAGDKEKVLAANTFPFVMAGTRREHGGVSYIAVEKIEMFLDEE